MKCVVTRDEGNGLYIDLWQLTAKIEKTEGVWDTTDGRGDYATSIRDICARGVCKLLGFTPRKGSKQVVEIIVKKIK